jgi:Putative MetA-pathway of phenol degradation
LLSTANRPTVGYSACAVKQGTVVFELGYQNQTTGSPQAGSVTSQIPQAFTRIGVAPRFELDVIGPNYVATRAYDGITPVARTSGVTDSGVGGKYELAASKRWIVGIDGLFTPPTGSTFLTAGSSTITGNLDVAYALSEATGLGTTIAVSSAGGFEPDGTHARYGVTTPSLVVTTRPAPNTQLYAEYVYVSKIAAAEGGRAFADSGVQQLVGKNLELDLEYGHSFIDSTDLRFQYIGAGFVLQIP